MVRLDHGPNCIACKNPEGLPALLTTERARLDADAARAREHRRIGEATRQEILRPAVCGDRFEEIQARMLYHLGTANAIASGVRMGRAHLDRVEKAHGGAS